MRRSYRKGRLEWLGRFTLISELGLHKSTLCGWLPQQNPRGDLSKRWRTVVCNNLEDIAVAEEEWYAEARESRVGWRTAYSLGMERYRKAQAEVVSATAKDMVCEVCFTTFRKVKDKKGHKCVNERRNPLCKHLGAVQCQSCQKWFRNRGGLAVHIC